MGKRIKQHQYEKARQLAELGLTIRQLTEITKLSEGTISAVRRFKTFAEYKEYKASLYQAHYDRKALEESKKTPTISEEPSSEIEYARINLADESEKVEKLRQIQPQPILLHHQE